MTSVGIQSSEETHYNRLPFVTTSVTLVTSVTSVTTNMALPALTIFDIETTGLDPRRGHRIIELAGVRIQNGVIVPEQTFLSFVNPERDIPFEAKQIHKISDEHVAHAPTIDVVLPQFLEFAHGSVLVAHNAQFDYGFLEAEKQFCWGYTDLPECLCSMRLSQNVFPTDFRHNLDVVCQRLGLTMQGDRHRALDDAMVTAQALLKMLEKGRITSLDELRKKAAIKQLAKRN